MLTFSTYRYNGKYIILWIYYWVVNVIIGILHGQTSNQLVIGERNCEMSFQFHSKANFQNFVQAIKSTNLQTHEPVHFKKTTKIEPQENKVFHSNYMYFFLALLKGWQIDFSHDLPNLAFNLSIIKLCTTKPLARPIQRLPRASSSGICQPLPTISDGKSVNFHNQLSENNR